MHYLIAGGGTGGHIIPAVNIARALKKTDTNTRFLFIGTDKGLEKDIVPDSGFELAMIDAQPWLGIRSLKILFRSICQVVEIIKNFEPDAVIGTGGYVSAPAALAAAYKRIPLFIQEQNTYPGLASKLGSLFARKVFLGFPDANRFLWRKSRTIFSGNPVELAMQDMGTATARRKFNLDPVMRTVLLTGGSQGASALNEIMKLMLEYTQFESEIQFIWQCGQNDYNALSNWLCGKELPIALIPFIQNMGNAYSAADVVICRAGALTLAEIAIAGIPAILVPYPYATAGHQRINAASFADTGAAIVLEQEDITPAMLAATINEIIEDCGRIYNMSESAKKLAKPEATTNIARIIYNDIK